jgi:hypothetical protein
VTPPSDGLGSVSERELVLAQRAAFERGCRFASGASMRSASVDHAVAAAVYPLEGELGWAPGSFPDGQEVGNA